MLRERSNKVDTRQGNQLSISSHRSERLSCTQVCLPAVSNESVAHKVLGKIEGQEEDYQIKRPGKDSVGARHQSKGA